MEAFEAGAASQLPKGKDGSSKSSQRGATIADRCWNRFNADKNGPFEWRGLLSRFFAWNEINFVLHSFFIPACALQDAAAVFHHIRMTT